MQHRDDGKNVNGWHWEEKSILGQMKTRLTEAFTNVLVEIGASQQAQLTLTGCKDISGDAAITTRKGNKRFAVYDLKLTVEWEVTIPSSENKVTGTVKVDEFSSASDEDDYVLEISTTGTGTEQDAAKQWVEAHGKQEVVRRLLQLAAELRDV